MSKFTKRKFTLLQYTTEKVKRFCSRNGWVDDEAAALWTATIQNQVKVNLFIFQENPQKTTATRPALFWLKYAPNPLSTGASPQTPLGSLQRSPDRLVVFNLI